jgi:hypothetical protein
MRFSSATEAGLWCVALGLIATGAGSAWFHLNPNDATLAWDRLAMTLVFAGMLGTAVAQRIGPKVARVSLVVLVLLGIASIAYWRLARDLSIYATFHAGAVVALLALLLAARRDDDPFPWWWIIGWYVLAKLFEAADLAIWQATQGAVAGHTLKHLAAAAAGAAAFRPLRG